MADIILLNGGTGQELVARSKVPPTPLWSAEIMEREPELVCAVHQEFIAAGATAITVNSYSATPERLGREMDAPLAERRFQTLQQQALDIALTAQAGADHRVALAGCLPPLAGSYHADAVPDFESCLASYSRIVALQGPSCAVMLAETQSSSREARAAVEACVRQGRRVWVAFTVDDADGLRLRSGETLQTGIDAVLAAGAEAILLNCSRPEAINDGLDVLGHAGVPFGAYANGFVNASELQLGGTVAGMGIRSDLGPEAYAVHAMSWIDRGATIVGGCCEVGPGHIAHLHDRILAAGHRVVAPSAVSATDRDIA